jgi:hypothetical protein
LMLEICRIQRTLHTLLYMALNTNIRRATYFLYYSNNYQFIE